MEVYMSCKVKRVNVGDKEQQRNRERREEELLCLKCSLLTFLCLPPVPGRLVFAQVGIKDLMPFEMNKNMSNC